MPRPDLWTKDHIAKLRELAEQELSAARIAQQLTVMFGRNFTRNAVIGKTHRLNARDDNVAIELKGGDGGGQYQTERKGALTVKGKRKGKTKMSEIDKPPVRDTVLDALAKLPQLAPDEPKPRPNKDFYGVPLPPNDRRCHYIHGDPKAHTHVYCNRLALKLGPNNWAAYCPYHAAVMHRDPRSMKDLSEIYL